MKKAILFIMLVAVLFLFYSQDLFSKTQDFSESNGYTWKGYHDYVKLGFSLGFLIGANKATEELQPYIRRSYYTEKKVEELVPIYNITNTQLKEKLDAFYTKSENMSIPIQDAAIIICKKTIPVKDKKMIEREKEILRLPPPKQRVERVKDHIKKEIKKGKYPKYEVKEEKIVKKETKEVVPLKTEEEVTGFWFNLLVPGGGTKVKEIVRVNYSLAIIIAIAAVAIIIFLIIKMRRKR